MKKLEESFIRGPFAYTQLKRDGNAALYSKVLTNKNDSPKWFETIVVCTDENEDETFPLSTSWELLGKTFPEKDETAAFSKYDEFIGEYGAEALKNLAEIEEAKTDDSVEPKVEASTSIKASTGKTRGRKKADVNLNLPDTGTFQAREIADAISMSVPFIHNRLKALVKEGKVRVVDTVKGRRGKPIINFEVVKAS